jgi:hypothetical protein
MTVLLTTPEPEKSLEPMPVSCAPGFANPIRAATPLTQGGAERARWPAPFRLDGLNLGHRRQASRRGGFGRDLRGRQSTDRDTRITGPKPTHRRVALRSG